MRASALAFAIALMGVSGHDAAAQAAPPAGPSAPPTSRSADEAFLHLQASLSAVGDRARADPAISGSSVPVIQATVNELQDLFAKGTGTASEAYVASLDLNATALFRAASLPDSRAASALLAQVREDLEIKLKSSRVTLEATGKKPTEVTVVVTTVRNTQPVSGYRLASSPALLADAPPLYPFNQLSSPRSSRSLPPGLYTVFAYQNDRRVAAQQAAISLRTEGPTEITVGVP